MKCAVCYLRSLHAFDAASDAWKLHPVHTYGKAKRIGRACQANGQVAWLRKWISLDLHKPEKNGLLIGLRVGLVPFPCVDLAGASCSRNHLHNMGRICIWRYGKAKFGECLASPSSFHFVCCERVWSNVEDAIYVVLAIWNEMTRKCVDMVLTDGVLKCKVFEVLTQLVSSLSFPIDFSEWRILPSTVAQLNWLLLPVPTIHFNAQTINQESTDDRIFWLCG